jgi:sporulation protein YlmC with PRC-barrel domain
MRSTISTGVYFFDISIAFKSQFYTRQTKRCLQSLNTRGGFIAPSRVVLPRAIMAEGEDSVSRLTGLEVYLPDGRLLGIVHDAVVDANGLNCTHLFVRDTQEDIVEGSVHVAVPWRWIRAIDRIVLLRWFPQTPIPLQS